MKVTATLPLEVGSVRTCVVRAPRATTVLRSRKMSISKVFLGPLLHGYLPFNLQWPHYLGLRPGGARMTFLLLKVCTKQFLFGPRALSSLCELVFSFLTNSSRRSEICQCKY